MRCFATTARGFTRPFAAMCLLVLFAGGCASYELRGTIVHGDTPGVYVVNKGDGRLEQPGIPNTKIEVTVDPNAISRKDYGAGLTDMQGQFAIPISEFGAGTLIYELGLFVRKPGYRGLYRTLQMPSGDKRLLIVLSPGRGGDESPDEFRDATIGVGGY